MFGQPTSSGGMVLLDPHGDSCFYRQSHSRFCSRQERTTKSNFCLRELFPEAALGKFPAHTEPQGTLGVLEETAGLQPLHLLEQTPALTCSSWVLLLTSPWCPRALGKSMSRCKKDESKHVPWAPSAQTLLRVPTEAAGPYPKPDLRSWHAAPQAPGIAADGSWKDAARALPSPGGQTDGGFEDGEKRVQTPQCRSCLRCSATGPDGQRLAPGRGGKRLRRSSPRASGGKSEKVCKSGRGFGVFQ